MPYEHIIFDEQDGVAIVTFNRPNKLNAFNMQTFAEVLDVVARVQHNPALRVLIFTGAGRAFSSGADVDMFAGGHEEGALGTLSVFLSGHNVSFRLHDDIENLTKPVIAAINGVAVGDGIELALSCDFRIASSTARVGFPEANIGLIPASGGCSRLVKMLGLAKAKELILLGDLLSADDALKAGLMYQVVPPEQVMPAALQLANKLMAKAPLSVGLAKRIITHCANTDLFSSRLYEGLGQAVLFNTADHAEGVTALRARRKPEFKGK